VPGADCGEEAARARLPSFGRILGVGFLLVVSLAVSAAP